MNLNFERINLNHLYYFYIVAKEGSVKGASELLHVTQPTISDQLKLLEEFLEVKLFERRSRSLFLNTQGKIALEFAEKIFGLAGELTRTIKYQNGLPKKTVDIGITNHMSQYFLYDRILPLLKKKEVVVNIKDAPRRHLIADLEASLLDVVFTYSKENLPSTIDYYRVGINKTFVVAHKDFQKYKRKFPQSLNKIPYFSYTQDSSLRYDIDMFFARHDLMPEIIGEGNDIDLMELITKEKLGFTIVPEVAKLRLCENDDIISLGEIKELQTSVWALCRKAYRGAAYSIIAGA